jgi:hypothetical protein
MPRKLRVRENPTQSLFGGIVGLVFVGIGIGAIIPQAGAFGYIWTAAACIGTAMSFYNAFSSEGIAKGIVEVPDEEPRPATDPEARLRKLEDLRAKSLITPAEYEERRRAILEQI